MADFGGFVVDIWGRLPLIYSYVKISKAIPHAAYRVHLPQFPQFPQF